VLLVTNVTTNTVKLHVPLENIHMLVISTAESALEVIDVLMLMKLQFLVNTVNTLHMELQLVQTVLLELTAHHMQLQLSLARTAPIALAQDG
jgi:hypothetical protein